MPSPFPGMDPWLEDAESFRDLHGTLITYLREAVNAVLPRGYVARGTQLVWVDDSQRREPDVGVFGPPTAAGDGWEPLAGMLAVAEQPVREPWEQPYLEIVTAGGKRLVTMIEVVSLSNKRAGDNGRTAYQQKQDECRLGGVNLVEIDLLRGGEHVTAVPLDRLQKLTGPFDYHVSVMTAGSPTRFYAVAFRLPDRPPTFRVPLDPGVPAVSVDLQPLLDKAYDTGRYSEWVNYRQSCDPPLAPAQQAWADGILRANGLLPEG